MSCWRPFSSWKPELIASVFVFDIAMNVGVVVVVGAALLFATFVLAASFEALDVEPAFARCEPTLAFSDSGFRETATAVGNPGWGLNVF